MLRKFVAVLGLLLAVLAVGAINWPVSSRAGEGIELASGATWKEANQATFRVDNFNIQRGKGKDGIRDLSRSIEVLQGADIVGLQETSGTLFYGWKDQAEQIAEAIGAGFLFAPTSWQWYQPYRGPALTSKFPVASWSITRLPQLETEKGSRILISAEVLIQDQPVRLLVTHLSRRDSNQMQLDYIYNVFRQSDVPTILMADLNVDDSNQSLQDFFAEPGITDAVEAAIGPFWRLDWIITKGFDVVQGGYTPRGISDHAHYWVELSLSQAQP